MRRVSLVVGLVVFGACGSCGGKQALGEQRGADYSATLADPVGFLPLDSELVLGLDAEQVRRSGIWKLIEPRLARSQTLTSFRESCGFDLTTAVRRARLGLKNLGAPISEGVMVLTGLDRGRVMGCADKLLRDARSDAMSAAVIDDGIVIIPPDPVDPSSLAFTFVDASSLVVVFGKDATKQQLHAVLKSGAPLRTSPGFAAMLGTVDPGRSLWFFVNGNSKVFEQAAAMGLRTQALFGSVSLGTGFAADVRLRVDSPETAGSMVTMLQGQLGMARGFFDELEVHSEASDVVIAAVMTDQQLEQLIALASTLAAGAAAAAAAPNTAPAP